MRHASRQRYDNQYGGAAPRIVREFIAQVRDGVKMTTSPIAAYFAQLTQ